MSSSRESAPIRAALAGVSYELIFIDDDQKADTVIMRLVFEPDGDVHEERVARSAADDKLTSSALVNDAIDGRIHDIVAERQKR